MTSLAVTAGFSREQKGRVPFKKGKLLKVHLSRASIPGDDQPEDFFIPPQPSFLDAPIDHYFGNGLRIEDGTVDRRPAGQLTGNSFTYNNQTFRNATEQLLKMF